MNNKKKGRGFADNKKGRGSGSGSGSGRERGNGMAGGNGRGRGRGVALRGPSEAMKQKYWEKLQRQAVVAIQKALV